MRINRNAHTALYLALSLGVGGCGVEPPPALSRVWPVMGTMMSVAAWGGAGGVGGAAESTLLARALSAAHDSVERIDSLLQRGVRRAPPPPRLDSVRRDLWNRTGVKMLPESLASGYALDRAALALAGVADSALLDLGGQYLWVGPPGRVTHRTVGIPDPENSLRALGTVELRSGSVRTHSQSPDRRGGSVRSVTVLAGDALTAQAWSIAFFAVGCDSAFAVAASLGGRISVVCADASGIRWTRDLDNLVMVPETLPPLPARAP